MTVRDIRSRYLDFFKARGHKILPSASLLPENDPTTLFTGSGMQPLIPYLLGKDHPEGKRLVNSQRCFRAQDIEEVGDNRHTTYFEMLGNWSLGDYFKQEQLPWFFEFLTKEVGIPQEKLWVTCFEGDEELGIPKDTESAAIWEKLGIPKERIRFYRNKNWWSRSGTPEQMPAGEPGGPDSEVFYEFTNIPHDPKFGKECHPNCDCGRFMEIGNSVFMQYLKKEDGSFGELPKRNVDFGGGLERIAAAKNNNPDIFLIDTFAQIIKKLGALSGKNYTTLNTSLQTQEYRDIRAFRIVADHVRAAQHLIEDGAQPSNVERGYVVRRLIRRAVRYADQLGVPENSLGDISLAMALPTPTSFDIAWSKGMPNEAGLAARPSPTVAPRDIANVIAQEEERFRKTLARGMKELARFASDGSISAQDAFQLVTTYGFPLELILEEAGERGIKHIDVEGFKELLKEHENVSRAGVTQKFKGGLADTSEKTTRLHTAHHLLLKALQIVLGPEVHQRGSNITQERLRIDFNYPQKVSKEQLQEIEKIVNQKIKEDLVVIRTEMSREEAEALHAEHEFGAKYPERVSVYSVGPLESAFSIEFCGGPHVERTGALKGTFKIQKEEAVAQGIRRIKATLE